MNEQDIFIMMLILFFNKIILFWGWVLLRSSYFIGSVCVFSVFCICCLQNDKSTLPHPFLEIDLAVISCSSQDPMEDLLRWIVLC